MGVRPSLDGRYVAVESNQVPIVEYYEGELITIADPDGVLIEIAQNDEEFDEKLRKWSN